MKINVLKGLVLLGLISYAVALGKTEFKSLHNAIAACEDRIRAASTLLASRANPAQEEVAKAAENLLLEEDLLERFYQLMVNLSCADKATQMRVIQEAKTEHEQQTKIKTAAFQKSFTATPEERMRATQALQVEGAMNDVLTDLEKEIGTATQEQEGYQGPAKPRIP